MNVNRVYVAQIYVNYKCTEVNAVEYNVFGKFIKRALVYHNIFDQYVDLQSGKRYKLNLDNTSLGEMYISLNNGLIPLCEYLDVRFEKNKISRKSLIKRLSNVSLLNKKEDDK